MKRGFLLRGQAKKQAAATKNNVKKDPPNVGGGDNQQVTIRPSRAELPIHPSIAPLVEYDANGNVAGVHLSYGKVDDDAKAIPEDYDPNQAPLIVKEMDPSSTNLSADPGLCVITSVPQPDDGDGLSEWIVNGPTKAKVLCAPQYPSRMVKPRRQNMYVVKETPDMGFGVFATCDIKCGELIFSERPLLVSPRAIETADVPAHYTAEQVRQVSMLNYEKMLQIVIGRMSPSNKEAFMSLMNNHKEDGSGPILGIIRTNGYGLSNLYDGDDPKDDKRLYTAVANIGSRINHSCRPNIYKGFDLASFSLQFRAYKDINAGEQLFYTYCDIDQDLAGRQVQLAPYGVICKCSSCTNATPESDNFRKTFRRELDGLSKRKWVNDPNPDVKVLESLLKLEKAMIQEGLDCQASFGLLLGIITMNYVNLRMIAKAREYSSRFECYKSL